MARRWLFAGILLRILKGRFSLPEGDDETADVDVGNHVDYDGDGRHGEMRDELVNEEEEGVVGNARDGVEDDEGVFGCGCKRRDL